MKTSSAASRGPIHLLLLGLLDAAGFVLGALAGWQLGVRAGFDFVGTPGFGAAQMVGLVFIMLGCGIGKWGAQRSARWLERRRA